MPQQPRTEDVNGATFPLMQEGHRQHKAFETTFRQYSSAILARDYATAYSLGDQAFRDAVPEQDFKAEQQALETKLGALDSSSTESLDIEGNGDPMEWTARVREVRNYRNGKFHALYEFRFENGRWQLFGFKQDD